MATISLLELSVSAHKPTSVLAKSSVSTLFLHDSSTNSSTTIATDTSAFDNESGDLLKKNSTSVEEAGTVEDIKPELPPKKHGKWTRHLQHTIFTTYRRLFTVVFTANLIAVIVLASQRKLIGTQHMTTIAVAASANLFIATAIRQEYIINIVFRTCWLIPLSAPLAVRRILAKCYEYGGVHSGAAISGTMWFILLAINIWRSFAVRELNSVPVVITTLLLMTFFCLIITFAHPRLRTSMHDVFERTHRWAGWASLSVFWVEIVMLIYVLNDEPQGTKLAMLLVKQPSFWLLFLSTCHSIHPWLRLRRWTFESERLSSHAIKLTFSRKIHNFSGIALSISPLKEWHPFATFPRDDEQEGGSLVISKAGDFTSDVINNPRTQYWVKGLPRHGPMSMAQIFRSVVFVTTGSGIGPCLTFLADESRREPVRILWSAPSPMTTFGPKMTETVRSIDPNAVIIDTRTQGRPDLPLLAYQLYQEAQAEAIFVLSNAKLTQRVKYAMEVRGVPVYSPIFDS